MSVILSWFYAVHVLVTEIILLLIVSDKSRVLNPAFTHSARRVIGFVDSLPLTTLNVTVAARSLITILLSPLPIVYSTSVFNVAY